LNHFENENLIISMNTIQIYNPEKLVFGLNSLDQFMDDFAGLPHRRLYLITIQPMAAMLNEKLARFKSSGILTLINTSVKEEPSFADFDRLLTEAEEFGADSVVGIGGGSVMDVAKLIAARLYNPQEISDILANGFSKPREIYLACIPTTAGTGSEVSPNAIFVNAENTKTGVISRYLVPDAAYIDPALTFSVPPAITAATGIDALAHCIEAYTNKYAHPLIDVLALEGIRLIGKSLRQAYDNGSDVAARSDVALGSMYGGMCLGPVNTAAAHALAYPLSRDFHVSHGLSVALLLPSVMEYNLVEAAGRYARVAHALGVSNHLPEHAAAMAGVAVVRQLIQNCGLPSSLHEMNIPLEAVPGMAMGACQVQRLLKNNPREITARDAEEIYLSAFNQEKECP
jgi:alcohol dehydrogenase class IV